MARAASWPWVSSAPRTPTARNAGRRSADACTPGETIEQAIEGCLGETLGSEVRAQRSPAPRLGTPGRPVSAWRADAPPPVEPGERAPTYAVELRGRLVPQGTARRLAWFLVTALPPRGEVSSAQWALLADFLEAQGEPAVAARMRRR